MPVQSSVYTLGGTVATRVVVPDNMPQQVILHNMTKSSNEYIHIGPSTVTTANSIHIDPGQTIDLVLGPLDDLWAVSDPSGLELGVLTIQKLD